MAPTPMLDRDPATHASLDNPGAVAGLLGALRAAGATSQAATLLDHAAADASLDDPYAVARLLDMLRDAEASSQVTILLGRDPAAHASLDNPGAVAELLYALRDAEATSQAAELIERLSAAGQFQLFCEQEGRGERFRFGRKADGRPAGRWAWTDLG